mgnify:CR=1 FL=1
MIYIMSCVWLDYMVKYFQCKNCVGSSPKTKKCVASFLVPGDKRAKAALLRLLLLYRDLSAFFIVFLYLFSANNYSKNTLIF